MVWQRRPETGESGERRGVRVNRVRVRHSPRSWSRARAVLDTVTVLVFVVVSTALSLSSFVLCTNN